MPGADPGGDATAIGAGAHAVVQGVVGRDRRATPFRQFTRYGLVVTAVAVLLPLVHVRPRRFARPEDGRRMRMRRRSTGRPRRAVRAAGGRR